LFEERGIACDYADLYREAVPTPRIADYDGLIFLEAHVGQRPLAVSRSRAKLVAQAVERGQPLLGICLGSQLIARSLGAEVHRNPAKESAGSISIHRGRRGRRPVWRHFRPGDRLSLAQRHLELPPGAARLAWSKACGNQAFRAGRNIYGLQFHPEVTPAMIANWQVQDQNCGDVRELDAPLDPHCNSLRLEELSKVLFGRWCDLL